MANASVASVTAGYNSAPVLPRQIDAMLSQTRRLQEIIVVDDASSDGTSKLLGERYPQIKVLALPKNRGVGGAWSAGMAYAALEKRHDWVWVFDADSVPEQDTLQRLLEGLGRIAEMNGQVGVVSPLLVHKESGEYYPPLYWRDGFVKASRHSLREPVLLVDMVLGSGMLIRREVVEKIGLLREDMFMYFQDFEYCLRARERGYWVAVVTSAKMGHEVGHTRAVCVPGFPRLWSVHVPWREYYMNRNLVYAAWHLYSNRKTKIFALRHMAKHAAGVVLFSPKKLACLKMMAQGFGDGVRGRLGPRVRPM